jgi:cell division septum initiation protein DivIVA
MIKHGDSPTTKKTIHELAKEFPEKTYRELEKYRDADRQEEAEQIPLTESQKSQDKLEPIGIGHNRPPGETLKKACTLGEMRKDRSYPDFAEILVRENKKLKKRAQEAEGELSILKGIETNRVKEAQAKCNQLQDELDKVNKEKNDLYNRIAELIEANEKEIKNLKWIKDHDYIFLVDENKKLHAEIKKLKNGTRVERARKAGL